jgi:hypothetical protein
MAYFKDLTVYQYATKNSWPLANSVGWLGPDKPFETALPTDPLLDRLWAFCKIMVNPTRGFHWCHLCLERPQKQLPYPNVYCRGDGQLRLGTAEIRVFSTRGELPTEQGSTYQYNRDVIFAAPNLIYHYVEAHHYKPPDEFVEALFTGPQPGTPAFEQMLTKVSFDWQVANADQ